VNASVNINDQQRTRVAESITRLNVQPLNNVNFSLTVGTAVPRDVRMQTLPSDLVEVVPQYRGYSFFVVRDEIVIVEPSTYQIVTVLPHNGGRPPRQRRRRPARRLRSQTRTATSCASTSRRGRPNARRLAARQRS
jgi:hypothetical protein